MNKIRYIVIALAIMLACSVASNVYFFTQIQSGSPSAADAGFINEFGNVLIVSPNYSFSPPITMYHALKIALESDSWNATSLEKMVVTVSLQYMEFYNSSSSGIGSQTIYEVTSLPASFSDLQMNSTTTYRYVWEIQVSGTQFFSIPPPGFYLVDAQTGAILPHDPLF